jgi:hypothetical protein
MRRRCCRAPNDNSRAIYVMTMAAVRIVQWINCGSSRQR